MNHRRDDKQSTRRWRWVAASGGFIVALVCSRGAQAREPIPLCMTLPVQLDDAGEDHGTIIYGEQLPARGIRVTILRPAPEPPLDLYLDDDGCTVFDSQFRAGFKLAWFPEAVLPVGGNNTIRVRAFADATHVAQRIRYPEAVHVVQEIGIGEMIVVEVPPADLEDPMLTEERNGLTNAIAVAVNTLHRMNGFPGSPLTGTHELNLVFVLPNNARQAGLDTIELGRDSRHERYVLAHEIGHWVQRSAAYELDAEFGTGWASDYEYTPAIPLGACDFAVIYDDPDNDDDVSDSHFHGLRSAEHNSAALVEGFAHFFAAVAFNEVTQADGTFRYYKDLDTSAATGVPDNQDFVDAGNRVSLAGGVPTSTLGGHSAWVAGESDCEDDWNHATFEISSGMDWMRFWWQFLTDSGGDEPEFWEIVHLLAFTDTHTTGSPPVPEYAWTSTGAVWPNLLGALQDTASGLAAYSDWFQEITPDHGVYNDGA